MWEDYFDALGEEPPCISQEEYRVRQSRLFSQLKPNDVILITSNPVSTRSNDVSYPYRNSSDMLYFCGWQDPDSLFFAYCDAGEWKSCLFVQPADTLKEIWEGRRPGVEGAKANWAIDESYSYDDLESKLPELIRKSTRVFLKLGNDSKVDKIVEDEMKFQSRDRQKFGYGPSSICDPSSMINELRLRKSKSEIEIMRYSAKIASQAHIIAMKNTIPGIGEYQLEGLIEGFFKYCKSSGSAYPPIIGSGENATILHYTENDDICNDGEIILTDAGCEYQGYASDITRSWPVNGVFSEAQAEIYQLVLESQIAGIENCQIGKPYDAPHFAAREVLAKGLIELGVIDQSLEDALSTEGDLNKWYMHNTGHWLGIDVHDVGVYKPNGEPRLLEEGMVVTVEPGLYFGAWRKDVKCPERYANIGIRIEDDVLITPNGPDILTSDCPKTITNIEELIG